MSVKSSALPPPPPLLQRGLRPLQPKISSAVGVRLSTLKPLVKETVGASETPPGDHDIDNTDDASVKGTFGWMTLDGATIPCIFRGTTQFVSVRMVEQKLLARYPSAYPEELQKRAPLVSQFVTKPEAKLLNKINVTQCACEYGQMAFTEKDLVVSWTDFMAFYLIVKKHFPKDKLKKKTPPPVLSASGEGGWVQINNTVVPYLRRISPSGRETLRLAPLPVIKYAANLLASSDIPMLESKEQECEKLTAMCGTAGLDFNFTCSNTSLVLLSLIPIYSDVEVTIKKLPDNDPFSSAEYCTEEMEIKSKNMIPAVLPTTTNAQSVTLTSTAMGAGGVVTNGQIAVHTAPAIIAPPAKRKKTVNGPSVSSAVSGIVGLNFVMPPPGMVPGVQGAWRPRPNNPEDMKKLAEMMNMQAAILSQTGTQDIRKQLANAQAAQVTPTPAKPAAKAKAVVEPGVTIRPIEFHSRKVSCLTKEGSKQEFALLEAISRVYFPKIGLEEFLHAVSQVLGLSVYQLNKLEESAFIKFYGLPTNKLKCNQVVNLKDLDLFMPQLKYMFGDQKLPKQSSAGKQNAVDVAKKNLHQTENGSSAENSNNKEEKSSNCLASLPPAKKQVPKSRLGGLSKLSKLEDAVNRMHKNKMSLVHDAPESPSIPTTSVQETTTASGMSNPGSPTCNPIHTSAPTSPSALPGITATPIEIVPLKPSGTIVVPPWADDDATNDIIEVHIDQITSQ